MMNEKLNFWTKIDFYFFLQSWVSIFNYWFNNTDIEVNWWWGWMVYSFHGNARLQLSKVSDMYTMVDSL